MIDVRASKPLAEAIGAGREKSSSEHAEPRKGEL